MKKNVFILLILLSSFTIFAQNADKQKGERKTPEQMAEKRTEKMARELSLNDEQIKKLSDLNTAHAKDMNGEIEKEKTEREAKRKEFQKKKDAYDTDLKKILSADQWQRYLVRDEMRKKKMEEKKKEHKRSTKRGGDKQKNANSDNLETPYFNQN